jgi:hypothetical protein
MDDEVVLELQLGRRPRAVRRVVRRCPFGAPAVTEQAAVDEDGRPFPTTYWLTCPFLVAEISRVEAAGGVEAWSRLAHDDAALARSVARADAEQRAIRPELPTGIAGSTRPGSLKCLHAHAAYALARPGYELGDRIVATLDRLWPETRCCTLGDRS